VEICTVGSVRGESVGAAMVDLNGHEAGNGGYGQGRSTARQVLLYSERCPVRHAYRDLERRSKDVLLRQLAPIREGIPGKPREQHPFTHPQFFALLTKIPVDSKSRISSRLEESRRN
jgi:hypothetical protein